MTQLQIDYWNMVLSAVSTFMVIIAAIAGAIKYFQGQQRDRQMRQEELAWRKTEFILQLADDFEKDSQHQLAWRLLTYGADLPTQSTLKKILGNDISILNKSEMKVRYAMDDYLDFFDRLYHFTFVTHALNIADIEVFGWYIAQIAESKEVHDYAKVAGFEDVLELNNELRKLFGKRHWYKTVEKTRIMNSKIAASSLVPRQKVRGNGSGVHR